MAWEAANLIVSYDGFLGSWLMLVKKRTSIEHFGASFMFINASVSSAVNANGTGFELLWHVRVVVEDSLADRQDALIRKQSSFAGLLHDGGGLKGVEVGDHFIVKVKAS